ncbi:MAG TPA: tRNA (guanosine(37)-N1)-methyltransferase TrmD [Candidatus Magasanikbacteria bacterium]|nr:MAG: tRNA (guanosine(37)-N1)-methyltransferase TrmD [Candidatus Magasanikbacteria bacterium RIFCSPLOWO2_02_FULL_47_16]OGH79338.1 MAG: tRNA (guanosine(37)-N1)-methyltransferase TrmD [Candidatus Magasanikbacteria bacterium RIFCSPHIGHO2_02_FULL_48_18]OGH83447.1 MAG: tRNA (guanosine(37)-N1)-methyltransferase TrmD [Candidatus Magasanikbacteria bacterium RIFCSPLOWO2_12_FULL_47_9b]HAZ28805.1 tRNA (guanosine(37)-N1)-methyltransferase TrmD [Candidatus Magasanikbacteria bacterium]
MRFSVLTLFPHIIDSYCQESILLRGQKAGVIQIRSINIRDFTHDKHKTVDDTPYGGGPGMVMKPEPVYEALRSIDGIPFHKADGLSKVKKIFFGNIKQKKRTILLSPRGRQFDQQVAREWSKLNELVLICGRYEGMDQRVADHMVDEEISIGPYVLAGGELGALVIIEAVSRLIPGVLGNEESLKEETFSLSQKRDHTEEEKEYPQYTKPDTFRGWEVPSVLLSGDHKRIADWRKKHRT